MNALVEIVDGGVRASSRRVAEIFGKEHKNVLRSIDTLIEQKSDLRLNFEPKIDTTETSNGAQREVRFFEMDRTGFSLLAMGFTGAKALEWKVQFITAFDAMEAALSEGLAPGGGLLGSPDAIERAKVALSLVREARVIFGRQGGANLWSKLGLPDPAVGNGAPRLIKRISPNYQPPVSVVDWAGKRVVRVEGQRVRTSELHKDYTEFCERKNETPVSLPVFARALAVLGIDTHHSNGSWAKNTKLAA